MITVKVSCGLGNQLYQYALAYRLAQERQEKVLIDALTYDGKYDRKMFLSQLKISLPIVYRPIMPKIIRGLERYTRFLTQCHVKERLKQTYDDELWNQIKTNCYVEGYWQSYKYFDSYKEKLFEEFTYGKKYSEYVEYWINMHEDKNIVSVHIRRGDYLLLDNCLTLEYYRKAIEIMREMVKNPIFVFFSDDIEWVRNVFADVSNVEFFEKDADISDLEEFFVMSSCKHNIIANSTFSWWASYLNRNPEKIVIAPSMDLHKDADIYPPEYIVLNCEIQKQYS